MITLPVDFVSDITSTMASLFTDFAPLISLVVGVLLGLSVILAVIHAIRTH